MAAAGMARVIVESRKQEPIVSRIKTTLELNNSANGSIFAKHREVTKS